MKKIFLSIVLAVVATAASAQTAGSGTLFYMYKIYAGGPTPERTVQMNDADACTRAVTSLQGLVTSLASASNPQDRVILIVGCR